MGSGGSRRTRSRCRPTAPALWICSRIASPRSPPSSAWRGGAQLRLRPRSRAENVEQFLAELDARRDADLARAFTTHGPHRDELLLQRDGRDLRTYGSQGEQRLALLSLLLAERDALAAERDEVPLLLLDDVASELDGARRERLVDELRRGGQAILTATEPGQVPGAGEAGVADVAVEDLSQP